MKNIVDSSAWLEFLADTKNAGNFGKVVLDTSNLLVPAIVIYEVFRKVLHEMGVEKALAVIAHMKQGELIDLDMDLAIFAGKISVEHKLAMADSIILATAKKYNAVLWTQDADFKGIEGVKYFKKK